MKTLYNGLVRISQWVNKYRTPNPETADQVPTDALLKDNNYHFRFLFPINGKQTKIGYEYEIDSRGGVTVTYRLDKDEQGNICGVYLGSAVCSPFDNYNKKYGRTLAAGRGISRGYFSLSPLSKNEARAIAMNLANEEMSRVLNRLVRTQKIDMQEFHVLTNSFALVTRSYAG